MPYSIMIDAGHGGNDPGAVYKGRREKDDNFALAMEVGRILSENGVDVLYTRTTDDYISPFERARLANEAKVDFFISFHRNGSPEVNQYNGVEVLVYDKNGIKYEMAQNIVGALGELGFREIGVQARPGLVVLRKTKMPALLIETGFLNSDKDNQLYDEKNAEIAQAIAGAILGTLDQQQGEEPLYYRDKDCDVVYVSPAHMTKWGEIMPVKRRLELLKYADERHHLVIEDDFENEFVYFQKPTPSLFGLSGGQGVVYIGSFSRLLLPSIRISFMILPPELLNAYKKKAGFYNQTASKAEQIALCQFIRDGHLAAQTRRLKRLYSSKLKQLRSSVRQVFGTGCQIQVGAAGTSLALTLPYEKSGDELKKQASEKSLHLQILKESEKDVTVLMSCSSMPVQDFVPACELLKSVVLD